jgi:predicted outer membrane repeat protein
MNITRSKDLRGFLFRILVIASMCTAVLVPGVSAAQAAPACLNAITVTSGADSGAGTLRQAIADICDYASNKITFNNDYTIALNSQLVIDKAMWIDGVGHHIVLDGASTTRVIYIPVMNKTVILTRLTISNGFSDLGAGIWLGGFLQLGYSTLSGNTATSSGGAIYSDPNGQSSIFNDTFYNNLAGFDGGAFYSPSGVVLGIDNTTFYGNHASSGGALYTLGALINNSLIAASMGGNCHITNMYTDQREGSSDDGTCSGFTRSDNLLLGPLGDYGGTTRTIPLLPGSPAINAGVDCEGKDQREITHDTGQCDDGAFETSGFTLAVTSGSGQFAPVNTPFAASLWVGVSANHAGDPVNGGQITFTAPGSGASAVLTGSPAAISGGSASVTANANNIAGAYTVTASASGANSVGFSLTNQPCLITVSSSADSGAGTLRQAINDICTGGTITFDSDRSITLVSQLNIGKDLNISGSGHQVTVSGGSVTRVLNIAPGTVSLSHLTLTNGNGNGPGGAILNGGSLTIAYSTFSANHSSVFGGAIENNGASLTIQNSTFSGNTAGEDGGAIDVSLGTVTMTNSTFVGNTASNNGGAVANYQGSVSIASSTFSGNSAAASGGGLYTYTMAAAVTGMTNSIVAASLQGGNCAGKPFTAGSAQNLSDDGTCAGGFTLSSSLFLGVLGSYGGDTQTLPLLPGSAAIDAGAACPTLDQRGLPRVGSCDAGAFEAQGYTLSVTGGNNQTTGVNQPFANPLVVTVSANHAGDPVNGGQVIFTASGSGASAALTGSPATITGGHAQVTARANAKAGQYLVMAVATEANSVNFSLTNKFMNYLAIVCTQPG